MDKKALLARCLVSGGMLSPLARIRTACHADVPILAYHRIWDANDEDRFPFDIELVSAGTVEFEWQMDYVRRNFDPITFKALLQILDGEVKAPPRPIIITFDDGYDDNYHHAFPILNALDIPATIFLSTGYIDGDRTFWYDRLANLLLRAPERTLEIKGLTRMVHLTADISSRRKALHSVLSELKILPNELRLDLIRELESELGAAQLDLDSIESHPLNWNQVREMAGAGIEFGSHTVTHPILSNLNDDELRFELVESRHVIERQIGRPVEVISYPVGGQRGFDERVRHAARAAGYRLGVSYIPGTNPLAGIDHYGIRRQHVERYTRRASFAAMLGLPEIFH